jgi:hypothetical protein
MSAAPRTIGSFAGMVKPIASVVFDPWNAHVPLTPGAFSAPSCRARLMISALSACLFAGSRRPTDLMAFFR